MADLTQPDLKRPIRKAVFPVAGLGTRFLPATKAVPKEMLTIVDRPVIQYAVDEARAAGITHFVFVTGRNKHVIEDHFDLVPELLDTLESRGKQDALDALAADQPEAGETSFTRQQAPLGLGHAVWCARDIVGDEPFALFLPDMAMLGEPPCMKGMVEAYERTGGNYIAVEECDPAKTGSYGIVSPERRGGGRVRDRRHGREARTRRRADESDDQRPVHPTAGDLRSAREPGTRCGRRDPVDGLDGPAARAAGLPRLHVQGPHI